MCDTESERIILHILLGLNFLADMAGKYCIRETFLWFAGGAGGGKQKTNPELLDLYVQNF